ncbi:uncharacterized protein LOC134726026 isoform X8 [Mytilus trossulus]|uniref:uncharacterized protein LOC134726026 isoform X8 n=1 Tax=Mytilus trossulus TaxID=6551 RepID=UPI0030052CC9
MEEIKEKPKPLKVDQGTGTSTEETETLNTSSKVDQGTDPLPVVTPEQSVNQEEETFSPEDQDKPLRVDQGTGTEDMGAGASKDGEVVDDDEQYVQRPERKRSNEANQEPGPSSPHRGLQQRPSIKGQAEPVVSVSANGFAVPEITIMEGQTVTFLYEEARPTNNVIQVIHDGDKLRPVIGGFSCDINKCKGKYNQQFNLEGEYKFAINNVRCTPLTVVVKRRTDLLAEITDDGFNPKKIYIDQGHSIKWQWKQCTAPHSVQEVKYCIEKGCFKKEAENAEVVKTVTGSFRQTFTRPGLYFFQTESGEVEKVHHCAVHVRETQREYKVELLDRSFQPMILLIEEGDRVWWFWDKFKCKKLHSVYQIEAPTGEHGDDEPYEPVQNGFRSSVPSKQGLLSHEFYTPGVYYYSDQNFQEAAEYIGTIIVKPKQKEHYVDLTEKGFTQDVVNAQTGDRIWWTWDAEESLKRDHIFHISEVDKMLNPLAKLPTSENEKYHHLNEDAIRLCTSVGLATTQYTTIGVYNYRIVNGPDSMNTCSVIVNPGPKNHTIHLTDNGFEPKVITVRPNDRVWWVWQSSKKPHDIIQVSHQGKPIDDGFCSGQARDAPSAFMHQFMAPGVFYFISSVLPKVFGAIVVSTQPQVHEVNVALEIRPDPVTIKCNDIVCWIFRGLRSYDVAEVKNVDQLTTEELESAAVTPRRCISQAVQKTGVIHFYSKSFKRQKKESDNVYSGPMIVVEGNEELMDDIRVSSVICDERYDNQVCRLDSEGFHPHFLYVTKGQSVLWTWKGNEEAHNIIHVSSPESKEMSNAPTQENEEPLNVISGPKAFNSGKPTSDNSFLYTFDEPGSYTVASQGAPGYSCIVFVLAAAGRVSDPFISSVDGGSVNSGTKITLGCDSPGSKIYFTIDGAPPELHLDSAKLYTEKGIKLKTPGLCFVRFMAVKEGFLNSHIITSRRYFVLPEESDTQDDTSDSDASVVSDKKPSPKTKKHWTWWDCVPTVKACFTGPGIMEIFWDSPDESNLLLIKGYQLFLNGVSYCEMFPPNNNSINISGLAGGRLYEVVVEVYSTNPKQSPQMSNKLMMKCPLVSNDGGPIISLERTEKEDAISVVWMSIDSRSYPISGYLVFLNDQQCGSRLVPDPDSNRCKVVIGGCELGVSHKVYVVALPKGEVDDSKVSNLLEVTLPLYVSEIVLPPEGKRLEEEELYLEYIEIHEGSGYLQAMDESINKASRAEVNERNRFKKDVTSSSSQRSASSHRSVVRLRRLDETRMKKIPETIVEVEQRKYKADSEDQSSMTDDSKKPPGGRSRQRLASMSEESESESESSETDSDSETSETDTETETDDYALPSEGSMVVMDAQRPYDEVRVQRREREIGRGSSRRLKEYEGVVERKSEYSPRPPETPKSSRHSGGRKQRLALLEVQDEVELNSSTVDGSFVEERRVAVPGDKLGASRRRIIDEGQMITSDGDGILPAPSISVESRGKNGLRVCWKRSTKGVDPKYKLLLHVVNIVGTKFAKEINNSDISFECNLVEHNKPVRGLQHCWNVIDKDRCDIKGLVSGMTYRVYVIANYTMLHGEQPCEIQTSSSVIYYTTVGPPRAPKLKIVSVDMYQALIEWDQPSFHKDLQIKGFQIYVDNKPLGRVRNKDTRQMLINNMVAGRTMSVYVVAVAQQGGIESEPSRKLHITCPRRPPAVAITQQPSHKAGCVLISWNRPEGHTYSSNEEDISLYGIYVDGKWYGKITASKASNRNGYQYYLNDLPPEQTHDINVKAIAGFNRVDPDSSHVFSLSDSPMSNSLPVSAPAAPKSPKLMLEGLHTDGIDVSWQAPQQFGDASISGYQMLKNGKLYGSIIPSDVNSLRIRDITLGEKIQLQLIALTDHPVGKNERRHEIHGDRDSGIDGSGQPEDRGTSSARFDKQKMILFTQDILSNGSNGWPLVDTNISDLFLGDRYAGCRPGAKLTVHYTGLVLPPSAVWCEQVSGHSALIVWNKDDEPRSHFIRPENYQVTWWPGDRPEDEINSDSTNDNALLITNLRPSTSYTVVVEARKMEKYKDIDEEENKGKHSTMNSFIIASKAEPLTIKTARPPDPPSNLGTMATTCSGIKLAWDQPREHGVEVIGIRVDAVSLNTSEPHHVSVDVLPDSKEANIEYLREKTDYLLRVTAITDEYFDRLPEKHKLKKLKALPKDMMINSEDSKWLPNSSIISKTAGTEPPANIRVSKASTNNMKLTWTPPIVYGSNKLTGQIVRWWDVKATKHVDDDFHVACHKNLLPSDDSVVIEDLVPGIQYKIVIEAVVSVKTALEKDRNDGGIEANRRTAHVMSKPMFARARAPTEPPRLYITGYTQTTAQLYWEKPLLVTVTGKDENGKVKYLRRYLEGYKLEINGKTYSCLGPNSQSCALTKCKPGKKYLINLVALTCTEEGKKERKRKYKGVYRTVNPQNIDYCAILDDEDNLDASPSETLEVVLPRTQEGNINTLSCRYTHTEDRDNRTFGDIELDWDIQGEDVNLLKQFNIVWYNDDDRVIQTKYVSPDFRHTVVPVTKNKSVYYMTVEPSYFTETLPQGPQSIQLVIPGPPDSPEIFTKSVSPEEFVIEWGEPRLYGGVRVRGYQVYLNDKKAGNELNHSHRKAVIPCKPNRNYRVQLIALSTNPEYSDSPKSNALFISTNINSPGPTRGNDDWKMDDDQDIPVTVTNITDSSIHLDWSNFLEIDGITGYKIQWSSVAQPAQREVRLSSQDSSCVINNCLPGTTHFVRLLALVDDGQIKERSKQYTIQTSAPADSPVQTVRACNFRYIAVQWDKPNTYGDAVITGYKVYVNGIVESILNADQLSFTFTHGKWCQEYAFQVQALTSFEKLHSKVSEPLLVTWPGCKPPMLKRLPTHSSSNMKIGWEDPYLTDGVKIKHFRACCIEEGTEKMVQSIGPIHPDSREAEFKHLKKGSYSVYVEIHLYGTSEIVCTEAIRLQPALSPDPPRIMVTVVGLEERRTIEKVTCDLVNIRDRLIRKVGHKLKEIGALSNPIRAEKNRDVIEGAHTLSRVEEYLEECFLALQHFTGYLEAHVSWSCPQTRSEMVVAGYKVLIDGKQYGSAMHEGVKTVRIKLGLEQPVYRLSMISMTDKPQATSEDSNIVELLSDQFKPFAFYCYHAVHAEGMKWPNQGCCKFSDSLAYERQAAKKLANQGLLKKRVPPPSCSLLDIFDGEYKPFLSTHSKQYATAVLFWTPWCLASQTFINYYARFAKEHSSQYNFIAVSCGVNATSAANRKSLIHRITSSGWREDRSVWHCTSQCASSIDEASSKVWKTTMSGAPRKPEDNNAPNVDLTEILGIAGVPTLLVIHPDGYIAWHGRYRAYDYAGFSSFMQHTLSEVLNVPSPAYGYDAFKNNITLDDDAVESVLRIVRDPTRSTIVRIPSERPPSPEPMMESKYADEKTVEQLFIKRKQHSPRSRRKKLTVNHRPYSASAYVQLLKSPYMQKVVPSPKVLNKMLRPASGPSGGPR